MKADLEIGKRIRLLRTDVLNMSSQQKFADELGGVTRGAVGNWEVGKGIKTENLQRISETFGASFDWLATGRGEAPQRGSAKHLKPNAEIGDKLPIEQYEKIPLYGHAVGGVDGEFELNGNKLDYIVAPPSISGVQGAYAVTVSGDSMAPRYEDGETVYVDPRKRLMRGNYVVAQVQTEENGPRMAFIKKFIRHNSEELVLEQFNPAKELRFEHRHVISVHYVVMGGNLS